MEETRLDRRQFSLVAACSVASTMTLTQADEIAFKASGSGEPRPQSKGTSGKFKFRYMLPSCMYGKMKLETILPEVRKIGAQAIDIWPKVHGSQREQLAAMGEKQFEILLNEKETKLGCLTQYPLGPFGLNKEIELAGRLNCQTIVTGGAGPKGLVGKELKKAVSVFAEKLKPGLDHARKHGVTVAIENHANNLVFSPDSLKWLAEFTDGHNLGIALAPYHLEQNPKAIANLVKALGNRIKVFYAWQHGHGCSKKLPKEEELLQLPGRGKLDFAPIVEALVAIDYRGWTEIFMHPVPRGIPIHPTVAGVTNEINRARNYLDGLIEKSSSAALENKPAATLV